MKELSDRLSILNQTYNDLRNHIPDSEEERINRKDKMYKLRTEIIQTQKEIQIKLELHRHGVTTIEELPKDSQTFIDLYDEYKAFYENPSTLDENLGELEIALTKYNRMRVLEQVKRHKVQHEKMIEQIGQWVEYVPIPESTIDELTNLLTQLDLVRNYVENDVQELEESTAEMARINQSISDHTQSILRIRPPTPNSYIGQVSTFPESGSGE